MITLGRFSREVLRYIEVMFVNFLELKFRLNFEVYICGLF